MTPMMLQWHSCKEAAKEAILLFRMGDFYEAFYKDALLLAKELDLTLTKRQEVPMAGIPWQHAESYIDRLVGNGHKVAIAEQMEDPKQAKGLVKRSVTKIITPATTTSHTLVGEKQNNYFASLTKQGAIYGLAILDLGCADFRVCEFEEEESLQRELYRLRPAECLLSEKLSALKVDSLVTKREEWHFDHAMAYSLLTRHFRLQSLDGLGVKGMVAGIKAAGALLAYLQQELHLETSHVQQLLPYHLDHYMSLDEATMRHLELEGALAKTLDRTQTAMGGRLLRQWIKQPLFDVEGISARFDAVGELQRSLPLTHVRDLERLTMKICSGYASPRELIALKASLEALPPLKKIPLMAPLLREQQEQIDPLEELAKRIGQVIADEPPVRLTDGGVIRSGFHPPLDELRLLSSDSKSWLVRYQESLREELQIKTLKVGFNRVFGYYLEVSRGQAEKMPSTFQRRQTLANGERFITPELKEFEDKVLTAEEQIKAIESELYQALKEEIASYSQRILQSARAIAVLDALGSLGEVAKSHNYCRPLVDDSNVLLIDSGRHPVVEATQIGERFIPNDTQLDPQNRLAILTGPNMAGKSTYIRQVALITLLAHIGSFVPAKKAHIGLTDKIFTRIGASDDLSRGQSTFMVEMHETANILHNATSRSLVILDEIGRGTSTYDGVSIAWAVAEHLLNKSGSRTLFATHYFELTRLVDVHSAAFNLNVEVQERDGDIVFLHKIVPGSANRSYGICVARLAGLPASVIKRAQEVLERLEAAPPERTKRKPKDNPHQLTLPFV
ncbi:MAG: DNA mismatch repair protein MutS [Verrucomicrobia bacterium]|nr:DNA mismatch repair protein MutS [Verrucomicrobiota bacterium]